VIAGRLRSIGLYAAAAVLLIAPIAGAQNLAVRGGTIWTLTGEPLRDGVIVIRNGKIAAIGPASSTRIPEGLRVLEAKVVTPGLIDAHTVVGLSGYLNQPHDQDQLETTAPMQAQLRAIDAYNAREHLVGWVRSLGTTTMHTGHGPGALVSGQTMIVKTRGQTVEEAMVRPLAMVAVTLGPGGYAGAGKSPGTRAKSAAMLRADLIKAQEYDRKMAGAEDKRPSRDLHMEALAQVIRREIPLLVTADRANDILTALRIADEFGIRVVLDSAAEAYEVADRIRASGMPVIVHPPMARANGERENLTMESASRLRKAGIPFALQTGFEGYVPKTRVLLFETAVAAANGLTTEEALSAVTRDAARILGIADRVGTLAPGLDGDLVLFDGDPFEYTSHVLATVIEGEVVYERE
jgi:imidazolonepropionase-like amidohydrolase